MELNQGTASKTHWIVFPCVCDSSNGHECDLEQIVAIAMVKGLPKLTTNRDLSVSIFVLQLSVSNAFAPEK